MTTEAPIKTLPTPETIPEDRLARAVAHGILKNVGAMVQTHHLLRAALQDETTDLSLAVGRLEQEAYSPQATLEAVEELCAGLQALLEAFREESGDPGFQIPPNLQDDFETRVELVGANVLEEMTEETVHEVSKRLILGQEHLGITKVDARIRRAVVQEIRAIIDFAMRDCYLDFGDERIPVSQILEETKSSAILALMIFDNSLLGYMIKESGIEETKRIIAMIIKETRKEIRRGKVPNSRKRRELELEGHDSAAGIEGLSITSVGALQRVMKRTGRDPGNTGER